jgi:hypothetical protein
MTSLPAASSSAILVVDRLEAQVHMKCVFGRIREKHQICPYCFLPMLFHTLDLPDLNTGRIITEPVINTWSPRTTGTQIEKQLGRIAVGVFVVAHVQSESCCPGPNRHKKCRRPQQAHRTRNMRRCCSHRDSNSGYGTQNFR